MRGMPGTATACCKPSRRTDRGVPCDGNAVRPAMTILALFSCVAWLVLLVFWGGFWRADQRLTRVSTPLAWPEVAILIPARNEAQTLGEVLHSHLVSTYPGKHTLIVTDDHSEDGTGDIARSVGTNVILAKSLPEGWSGKLWALHNALEQADQIAPQAEYLLLTDADIIHDQTTLQRLVAKAQADELDLVSLMARLDARGLWGALLIPAFIFFFQKRYPFPWVNRHGFPLAAAAGGCILVRRGALSRIGDFPAIRDALIDDCALAARIKRTGGRIWLGLADTEVVSLRDNRNFWSVWTMVRRTAFTQLRHSMSLLVLAVLGMAFLYLVPVLTFFIGVWTADGTSVLAGTLGWALMAIAYWPTLQLYGRPWWHSYALPLAAALYTAMTVASGRAHVRGKGGAWKGRTYG